MIPPGCTCATCGEPIGPKGAKGMCRRCYNRAYKDARKTECKQCGAPISGLSPSGLCRSCAHEGTGTLSDKYIKTLRPCNRCGITTRREVCRDCADVLGDEIGRWVA